MRFQPPPLLRLGLLLLSFSSCRDTVAPDLAPPAISFRSPGSDPVADADSLVLHATATDDREVAWVRYRVNGGAGQPVEMSPAAEVAVRVVLRELRLGANEVELSAGDADDQVSVGRVTFLVADVTAPSVALSSPAAGAETHPDSVEVVGVASDRRGVARVAYRVDAGEARPVPIETSGGRASLRFVAALAPGARALEVIAYDSSGNAGSVAHALHARDVAPPGVSVLSPAQGAQLAGDSLLVEGVAEDDQGVVRLVYRLDGKEVEQVTTAARRVDYRVVLRAVPAGLHEFTVVAYDAAGNSAAAATSFTVTPAKPGIRLRQVASGLVKPLHLTAPAGDRRLFVVEQPGRIRVIENGRLLDEPFLDLSGRVRYEGDEGLLGLAFHPDYAGNGYFFVDFIDREGDTRVERYRVGPDPDRADPASAEEILFIDQPARLHKGGMLLFGPDGMLYVGTGDGAGAGDYYRNAQNRGTLLGAILRIDVDAAVPYAVPADNPLARTGGARGELWAMGLRNPWRFAFDPVEHLLYVTDVGEDLWEEVNVVPVAPSLPNFGWPVMEGAHCFQATTCADEGFVSPVLEYSHEEGCSVTGGLVYRGTRIPALRGHYLYGDFCAGFLRSFRYAAGQATERVEWDTPPVGALAAIALDGVGEPYLVSISGTIYAVEPR